MKSKKESAEKLVVSLAEVSMKDVALVGGKNASLGELIQSLSEYDIHVPGGFALTSYAYWDFIYANKLKEPLKKIFQKLDKKGFSNIETISSTARKLILTAKLPNETRRLVNEAYKKMQDEYGKNTDVAVRSSATAEDLPGASFAGQHDSFLNVRGTTEIDNAILHCYASLFNERAIKYREDKGYDHLKIAVSTGVQKMVRSDAGASGVCFTIEPNSGFRDVIHIAGSWGLGENVVKGAVNPDEFLVFKKTLQSARQPILRKKMGTKEMTMIYASRTDHRPGLTTVNVETKEKDRNEFILTDEEIISLANTALIIERHYKQPMDIEWAKDGTSDEIFIVQARPETAHAGKSPYIHKIYSLKERSKIITSGIAVGSKIASGRARILHSPSEASQLKPGEILVTEITNPDWNIIMKKSGAIITNKGGRTSHASIVARELGIAAVVGTENATKTIKNGDLITVSCSEGQTGNIYKGQLKWEVKEIDLQKMAMPDTEVMLIMSNPDNAFNYSFYPNNGIGLLRLEFIITNSVKVHPMALVQYKTIKDAEVKKRINTITSGYDNKEDYFTDQLSQSVGTIAAAFHPKPVIVRMSDFKTNEYANLLGGKLFEPQEENPMLGFRGASRYYDPKYKEGFRLECEAMKKVRDEMGLTNVKLMIPFCRTVEEAKNVIEVMEEFGLTRGENGLEIYMMTEIPSNVLLAEEFAKHFDGFSIGSNDLTQLTLGIDRDSAIISKLFDENNPAAMQLISLAIRKAKAVKRKIGLCGQAPSDFPLFAMFLVEQGIDSISFNADAIMRGIENIMKAEEKMEVPAKV